MHTYGIGFDFGNSHATGVLSTEETAHILTLPSTSAPGSLRDFAAMQSGSGGGTLLHPYEVLQQGDYVISYNGGPERFVGQLAMRQTRKSSTGRGDIHRYWSPRSLELLLTIAGTLIPDEHFSLLVVTGLPVETFRNEETRKKVKQALNGHHSFVLNGRSRVADIKVGKVLMEGAGAALALGIPQGKRCGIIDIGEFTTDIYATKGLEAISYLCGGSEIGIAQICERVNTQFARIYGRALSAQERIELLHGFLRRPKLYPDLASPKGTVSSMDLDTWMIQAVREIGRDINEFVSSLWRTDGTGVIAGDFDHIQIIGGGAYYLLDTLQEILPRAVRTADPEHDNARGYGWFASQLVASRSSVA